MYTAFRSLLFIGLFSLSSAIPGQPSGDDLEQRLVHGCETGEAPSPKTWARARSRLQAMGLKAKEVWKTVEGLHRRRQAKDATAGKVSACIRLATSGEVPESFAESYTPLHDKAPRLHSTESGVAFPLRFGKRLYFFGSPHSGPGAPDWADLERFQRKISAKGQAVLIGEGIPTSEGSLPCGPLVKQILDGRPTNEADLLIRLAIEGNALFVGGEPDMAAKIDRALRLLAAPGAEPKAVERDVLMTIAFEDLVGRMPEKRDLATLKGFYDDTRRYLPKESGGKYRLDDYPFDSFLAWYGRSNLKAADGEALEKAKKRLLEGPRDELLAESGPLSSPFRTNQVSVARTQARNEHLYSLLSCIDRKELASFTVYGDGHLAMLHRALGQLGRPSEIESAPSAEPKRDPSRH